MAWETARKEHVESQVLVFFLTLFSCPSVCLHRDALELRRRLPAVMSLVQLQLMSTLYVRRTGNTDARLREAC